MEANIKRKWVDALRSSNYQQGKNYLHQREQNLDSYCCLGVLAEVCKISCRSEEINGSLRHGYDFGDNEITLTYPPAEWQGLSTVVLRQLAEMNDIHKNTFTEIADWIEQNL